MIHFVHPWRKWLILSQKSAESISGLVVKTGALVSVSGVCQEDAAILASCRNYFLKRPTNRDINKSGHFQIVQKRPTNRDINKSGHFQIVHRSVLAFVVTLTIVSKRKAQRSWVHQRHGSEPFFFLSNSNIIFKRTSPHFQFLAQTFFILTEYR